ncbi:hypothetical protein JFU49_23465 [Pseudomonas sp. TH03]|uniref:hypothetical protein n=1 Tax=Pseudomonas sp. TH03 TaxID=2796369 RepID=UPI001912BC1A|nr:hypothetical protein [Pseudomonas sp. TH03]MBK5553219.1 hypothetical protein [Pseudomonas sp. TH03]
MSAPTLFSPITKIFPQNKPIFLGKGVPGTEITVCQSNTGSFLAKTTVDQNGCWLAQSTVELPQGKYAFTAYPTATYEYAPNTDFYVEQNVQPPTQILVVGTIYVYQTSVGLQSGSRQVDASGHWILPLETLPLDKDLVLKPDGTVAVRLTQLENGTWVSG